MKKILLSIFLYALLCCPQASYAEPVSIYGFTPASVDSLPGFQPRMKPRQMKEIELVTFLAKIDKKGKVKSIKAVIEKDSLFIAYIDSYVRKLTFQPARIKNKKKKSLLPFQVMFAKRINSPQFSFPLEKDSLVKDNDLFEYACRLNKVELPKVLSFPSYFADMNVMDSSNRYPIIIEKISLKEKKYVSIGNELSTFDPFVQQIQSSILYANISQPKIKKKNQKNDLFLMVSFYSQLSYPVAPYDENVDDSTNEFHSHRVRLINRFSALLSEPIPKSNRSNRYSRIHLGSTLLTPIDILIRIDTLGGAAVLIQGTKNKKLVASIRELISRLKFYPAVNQQNELVEFKGIIRIEPFDELDVRISYLWDNSY